MSTFVESAGITGSVEGTGSPELSIVMPCLNEAQTLPACIATIQRTLKQHSINGEIVVADNGSSDGCPQIALSLGAHLSRVSEQGYGKDN